MRETLKERLLRYLKKCNEWVPSGEIQRIVANKTTYTPRTTVRRLQELAESGALEVKMVRGHAHYKFKQDMGDYWKDRVREFEEYQTA